FRGLYGYGLEIDNHGDHKQGEKYYRQAIDAQPSYPEPHYALALLLLNQGRYDESIREANVHAELARNDPEPFIIIGNAYFALHKYDDAAIAYRTAVERKPTHMDARFNLGNALYAAGGAVASADDRRKRYDEALTALEDAIRVRQGANLFYLRGNVLE